MPANSAVPPSASKQLSLNMKLLCCSTLVFFTVSGTLLTEASKSSSGSYDYNTTVVPLSVEIVKLFFSGAALLTTHHRIFREHGLRSSLDWSHPTLLRYALPALCYFISNNCFFFIIRELGPARYQIMSNLKILSTAVMMRVLLSRELTWAQVKALIILVCGSVVAQIGSSTPSQIDSSEHVPVYGYLAVCASVAAAGTSGVYSEKLLKFETTARVNSIHWQNCQLYFFGIVFGIVTVVTSAESSISRMYSGFDILTCLLVLILAACGILVSFVLKYLDNFAKIFINTASMLIVAVVSTVASAGSWTPVIIGVILTSLAVEQFLCSG